MLCTTYTLPLGEEPEHEVRVNGKGTSIGIVFRLAYSAMAFYFEREMS